MKKLLVTTLLSLSITSGAAFAAEDGMKEAVFAGGCFWCLEKDFEAKNGVIEAVSGYAGGESANPTYKQVSGGGSGHKEVIQVTYDPAVITYGDLLKVFWQNIDPFDDKGQFCDKGDQYRAAIFYGSDAEQDMAEQSKALIETQVLKTDVVTGVEPLNAFYPAEDYHQNYYKTNSVKYKFYRWNCGRDARLEALWENAALSPLDKLNMP